MYMYIYRRLCLSIYHYIVCESNNSVMVSVPAYFIVCRHLPQLTCPCNVLEHSVLHLKATNFVKDICTYTCIMFRFVLLKFPDVTDIQCIFWWRLFLQIQTLSPKRVMFALCNSIRKFNLTCHAYSNVHCISNTLLRSIKERENAMLYILYPIIVPFILWYGLVLIKLLKLCPKIRILPN